MISNVDKNIKQKFRAGSGIRGLLSLSFVLQYQTVLVLLSTVALHCSLHVITGCSAFLSAFLAGFFFFFL